MRAFLFVLGWLVTFSLSAEEPNSARAHIPIGTINTRDALKTFIEDNGAFSLGAGGYSVFPDFPKDAGLEHRLREGGVLIPVFTWKDGALEAKAEWCQVEVPVPSEVLAAAKRENACEVADAVPIVAWRVTYRNPTSDPQSGKFCFQVSAKRPGPANRGLALPSWIQERFPGMSLPAAETFLFSKDVSQADVSDEGIWYEGRISNLLPGASQTFRMSFPVHPGQYILPHRWEAFPQQNAMVDTHPLVRLSGQPLSPEMLFLPRMEEAFYARLDVDRLFQQAETYWRENLGLLDIQTPSALWNDGFKAMLAHAGICMNDNAPDVAVLNYNVYNRDGMYLANMFQKSGQKAWSEKILDYFFAHPFNGRPYPEADNPGQVLWAAGEHWQLTRDEVWLQRIWPKLKKLASMVVYYRTTPGPHWVNQASLDFGDALPEAMRQELVPGSCDGHNPNYTEAFDVAGLRRAAEIAQAFGDAESAQLWSDTAEKLMAEYTRQFGENLPRGYGSFSVLWPCELVAYDSPQARDAFQALGAQGLAEWRYFAPARAHQSLLAGNREAGWKTVQTHLEHPQMKTWYAFDEGGLSGSGAWPQVATEWKYSTERPGDNLSRAMPHGWAIAEVWLLMRDCLYFESGDTLVLFAGIPEAWFHDPAGITIRHAVTRFGVYDIVLKDGHVTLSGSPLPPGGFRVCR